MNFLYPYTIITINFVVQTKRTKSYKYIQASVTRACFGAA